MDKQLLDIMVDNTPKFNPRVASGFVVKEIEQAPEYINNIILSAQEDFPEGLVYLGMTRMTPEEEYERLTYKNTYDISKSSIYGVKLKFEYKGEPLKPQYLFLPYLEEGGILTISGSKFVVTPVLIDKTFSVGTDSIFLYINRTKLTFEQFTHNYFENDQRVSSFIVSSQMYYGRNPSRLKAEHLRHTHKMRSIPVHYLLAKDGVTGMFKRYFDTDVAIGDAETINPEYYDPSEWTICSSIGVKPQDLRTKFYNASRVRLAIRNSDLNMVTRSVIAGLFYIIDFYPNRVKPEYADDSKLWYLLLALTLKPDIPQESVCLEKLDDHYRSLDTFVDNQVRMTLAADGVYVSDIFDILVEMIKTYPTRINITTDKLASMYGKRLVVLRYLLAGIRSNIFNMGFDLQSLKNGKKPFDKTDIEKKMQNRIKPLEIMKVNRNPEVNSIANPTDNLVPTMTLPVKQQTSMAGNKKGVVVKFTPAMALDASIAEVGNLTSDAKDTFTGRDRLNPYVTLGDDGTVLQNPELMEVIAKTQRDIKHE